MPTFHLSRDIFNVLGGWRLNPEQSIAYCRGGCRVTKYRKPADHIGPDRDVHKVMLQGGEGNPDVFTQHTSTPMGTVDTPVADWPLMYTQHHWTTAQMYGANGAIANDGRFHPQGLLYLPATDTHVVAVRHRYATVDLPQEFVAVKVGDGPWEVRSTNLDMQLGGGLDLWSQSFADEYFGGRRIAYLGGGPNPGQHGTAGLAVGAMRIGGQDDDIQATEYATVAEIGLPSTHESSKDRVMRSLPTYFTNGVGWTHAREVIDGELVGYWGTNSLQGCPGVDPSDNVWAIVQYPKGTASGLARVSYDIQRRCLCSDADRGTMIYRVDHRDIASAANGDVMPWEVRSQFIDFGGVIPGKPESISFIDGLAYIFATDVWKRNTAGKLQPAIFVVEIDGVTTPTPTPEAGRLDRLEAGQASHAAEIASINRRLEAIAAGALSK